MIAQIIAALAAIKDIASGIKLIANELRQQRELRIDRAIEETIDAVEKSKNNDERRAAGRRIADMYKRL